MRSAGGTVLFLLVAVAAGCTIGPEEQTSSATLTVTRGYGDDTLVRSSTRSVPEGETVMRFLQRRADVETRYGGRFVAAIEGARSRSDGGRRRDWFYYVNGIEAGTGATERDLEAGDRVWWDYHDWSEVMRVPAVVGSYPEPFVHGSEGKRFPVRVDCAQSADATCKEVADRLDRAGATASTTALGAAAGKEVLRVVVGEWRDVRRDAAARQLEEGPQKSGVFARVAPAGGGFELELLDERARRAAVLSSGGGIVGATRFEEQQPTWVVAGTDALGLRRAAGMLTEAALRDRFAVAAGAEGPVPLPFRPGAASRASEEREAEAVR